jgi:hypothetical protein
MIACILSPIAKRGMLLLRGSTGEFIQLGVETSPREARSILFRRSPGDLAEISRSLRAAPAAAVLAADAVIEVA